MKVIRGNGTKVLVGMQCNCCGRKIVVERGIIREGSMSVNYTWDYFSEKDGETHNFDLCEACYDQIVSQFKIPVQVQEETILA